MLQSPRATIQFGDEEQQIFSEGWKSEIEMSAGLVPSDNCEGESGGLLEIDGVPWLVNA